MRARSKPFRTSRFLRARYTFACYRDGRAFPPLCGKRKRFRPLVSSSGLANSRATVRAADRLFGFDAVLGRDPEQRLGRV